MNITVYLPDALGESAKAARINLSRTLRDAIEDQLERQATINQTLAGASVYELKLQDERGQQYTGRLTGVQIAAERDADVEVYLTIDERVIAYRPSLASYSVLPVPADELPRLGLSPHACYEAFTKLGMKPVIDV